MSYDRSRMKLDGDGSRKVDTVAIRDATQQAGCYTTGREAREDLFLPFRPCLSLTEGPGSP